MAAWTLHAAQTGRCLSVHDHSVERWNGSGSHRPARSRFRDAAGKGPPRHAAGYRDFRKFTAGIFRASRYLATVRRATTNPCSASNSAMRLSERGDFESSAPISCLMSARIAVDDAAPPVSVETCDPKKYLNSSVPNGVSMYLPVVTRETVDSCKPSVSAISLKTKGRIAISPCAKKFF